MNSPEALNRVLFFSRLSVVQVQACASLWSHRRLLAGAVLWEQGSHSSTMAILISGTMEVLVDGRAVGRIDPDQILGDLAAFTVRTDRTASLRANITCDLLEISLDQLSKLAQDHVAVYNAILDAALGQSVSRINAANLQIARRAEGTGPAPMRARPEGAVQKLWAALSRPEPTTRPPGVATLLRHLHGLFNVDQSIMGELSGALTPKRVKEGVTLFLEGEDGDSVFLIGDAEIDVVRNVGRGEAKQLVVLGPGSLVGTGALIMGGGRRSASAIPNQDGWVYEMTSAQHQALTGQAARAWKEALMGEIRGQIISANTILSGLGEPRNAS